MLQIVLHWCVAGTFGHHSAIGVLEVVVCLLYFELLLITTDLVLGF